MSDLLREAWIILLKLDQRSFPLSKPIVSENRRVAKCKVIGRFFRASEEQITRFIGGSEFIPLLAKGSPLTKLLMTNAHLNINPTNATRPLHLPPTLTFLRMIRSVFSAISVNIQKQISAYLSTCSGCLRTLDRNYKVMLGKPLQTFNYSRFFVNISIDILGRSQVRLNEKVKKYLSISPLIIACLDTGAILIILMYGETREDVKLALRHLTLRTGSALNQIVSDHGVQFAGQEEILPGVPIRVCHKFNQRTNKVERTVQLTKDMYRRVVHKNRLEPDRQVYTLATMQMLVELLCYMVNSIPYSNALETDLLSPEYFCKPASYLLLTDEEIEMSSEGKRRAFGNRLREFLELIAKARNDWIAAEEKRFREEVQHPNAPEAQVGDVVFLKDRNTYELARLGLILEISEGGASALVRLATGKKDWFGIETLRPLCLFRDESKPIDTQKQQGSSVNLNETRGPGVDRSEPEDTQASQGGGRAQEVAAPAMDRSQPQGGARRKTPSTSYEVSEKKRKPTPVRGEEETEGR